MTHVGAPVAASKETAGVSFVDWGAVFAGRSDPANVEAIRRWSIDYDPENVVCINQDIEAKE